MNSKPPEEPSKVGLCRIFRAISIGIFIFIFLTISPILIYKISEAKPPRSTLTDETEEPIYRDKNGNRINEPDYEITAGYDLAKKNSITSHATCNSMAKIFQAEGCHRYVTEQKHFPSHVRQENFDSGKTTEQCRAEVNAYYEPLIQDIREKGDDWAATVQAQKHWFPETQECQNFDNIRISKVIYEPTSRLQEILKKIELGGAITEEDRTVVLNDLAEASKFPDHPAKLSYIEKSDYFFKIADGKIKPQAKSNLQLSCREYQEKIDGLKKLERKTIEAQAKLKRSDGVVTDSAQWNALNQSRIDRLLDWKIYTDGAKTAGCSVAYN